MAVGGTDTKQLILRVEAATELAKRNLDDLARAVQADSAKMDKSLAGVDGALGRLGGAFGKLSGIAGGFGLALGGGAILQAGRDILKFADDIDAAATQAGLSVERYQTLTEAFRTLEIDAEQTDKILKTLQSTLGDVQNGAENSATKALDRLGISARVMSGEIATSDELLDALAAASSKAVTQAQFTADVVDIFGRKVGVDLAAALADGGKALNQLEQDVRDAGLVISEEMVGKLADANESIDQFAKQTKIRLTLAAGHAIDFASDFSAAIGSLSGVFGSVTNDWSADLNRFFESARGALNTFTRAADAAFARSIPGRVAGVAGRGGVIGSAVSDAIGRIPFSIAGAIPGGNLALGAALAVREGRRVRQQDRALRNILGNFDFLDRKSTPVPVIPRVTGGGSRRGGGGGARRGGGAKRSTKSPGKTREADEVLRFAANEEGSDYLGIFDLNGPLADLDEMGKRGADLARVLSEMPIPDLSQILPEETRLELESFALNFNQDLAGGLAQAILFGEDLGDVLENTFKRAAAAMLQSGILNFLTGGKEGTSFAAMFANIGKIFGGGRASGGPVDPSRFFMVGERGPELFVPKVPGNIIPNHALRGGSPVLNLTVNAPGATAETVMMIRREMAAAAPALVAASQGAVMRNLGRTRL